MVHLIGFFSHLEEDIAGAKRDGVFEEGDNTSKCLAELQREQTSRHPQQ
jgi:hypothetical protein